ncbi:MAG: CotH kinase family protein [Ruminococcus sp.]|nr:CotH kinase family protein [Ruminococcus sp.]
MKKELLSFLTAAAVFLLSGCSLSNTDSSQSGKANSSSSGSVSSGGGDSENKGSAVAVIDITTNDQSDKKMDFVTKPVAAHVSEAISTWMPGYVAPPEPYYEDCTVTVTGTDSKVQLENAVAKVKVRGNWTTNYEKKPLRIKFDRKQSLLGLNGGAQMKNWVLLACYKDGSMMRDKSALSIAREILGADGLYAADAAFVEVNINGQYWGMYLLTELQQVNENRVDITEPEENYAGTDIGYFLEYDGYYDYEDDLQKFHVDYNGNAPLVPYDGKDGSGRTMKCLPDGPMDFKKDIGFTIKSDIYSQAQHDFIASYVNNVYDIMYHAAYDHEAYEFDSSLSSISKTDAMTPQEAVEKVVNVDSLADMYLISELTCDADIYWSSFFMDADFGPSGDGRLTFEAPWDFDSGLGNKDRCANGDGFYAANIVPDVDGGPMGGGMYETINPWLAVLMYEDWYQDLIREKWTACHDSGILESTVAAIDSDAQDYKAAFDRNYQRWDNIVNNYSFVGELSEDARACKTHEECSNYLRWWLQNRIDFMNAQWLG